MKSIPINYNESAARKSKTINKEYAAMRAASLIECNRDRIAGNFSGQGKIDMKVAR